MSSRNNFVDLTRDDHCHGSHRQRSEEKKQNCRGKREGMTNRPGETCTREDIMKRNPSVGRKLPVTWLRQHAIVSGIIKHIGSICPWKRNTLSPRAIQEPFAINRLTGKNLELGFYYAIGRE
ncbi:hypothetical protein G5I_05403 [Acromyrmex echinatior]|uniref:Uncharacterized protein n=1 Tax=Acromyrmex echinatior TaxID=103372 RepID=F4WI81_ACREC|nr:hypothetical protein G5I_05403 [Acromyrmex echinatior]